MRSKVSYKSSTESIVGLTCSALEVVTVGGLVVGFPVGLKEAVGCKEGLWDVVGEVEMPTDGDADSVGFDETLGDRVGYADSVGLEDSLGDRVGLRDGFSE